jgi:hypothetical protein
MASWSWFAELTCAYHFRDRQTREVNFSTDFKIGKFSAVDFFGDQSLYLLDVPGMSALLSMYQEA